MSKPRVLIVDDNALNVEMASFLLTQAGMSVASTLDPHQVLEQVAAFKPDLILMDVQMPEIDGMTLTRQLRSQSSEQPMVIVAFTAYAMVGDKEKFLAAGCNAYIAKPINVATFAEEVWGLLPGRG